MQSDESTQWIMFPFGDRVGGGGWEQQISHQTVIPNFKIDVKHVISQINGVI